MYIEEIRLPRGRLAAFALVFALVIGGLIALALLVPRLPPVVRLVIVGAALLQAVLGLALIRMLSQMRITIDDTRLVVALRLLVKTRIPLAHIATCGVTDWRGWGISYTGRGTVHRPTSDARRGVWLTLTSGAQVLFTSRDPDAVCAALRVRQPAIEPRDARFPL